MQTLHALDQRVVALHDSPLGLCQLIAADHVISQQAPLLRMHRKSDRLLLRSPAIASQGYAVCSTKLAGHPEPQDRAFEAEPVRQNLAGPADVHQRTDGRGARPFYPFARGEENFGPFLVKFRRPWRRRKNWASVDRLPTSAGRSRLMRKSCFIVQLPAEEAE